MKRAPFRLSLMVAALSTAIGQDTQAGPGTVNGQPTYFANSPILAKFKDTLPGLSALQLGPGYGPNNLGQYLPVASALPGISSADILSYPGSDYFELAVVDYLERMHSDLQKPTLLRGYVQIDRAMTNRGYDLTTNTVVANPAKSPNSAGHKLTNPDGSPILIPLEDAKHNIVYANGKPVMVQAYAFDKPHYLGPVIVAMKDRATRIKFNNLVKAGAAVTQDIKDANGNKIGVSYVGPRNGDLFIPTDHTLAGTELIPDPTSPTGFSNVHFRENRAILHLHGGSTPWISDGTPHQWIVPAEDELLFKNGGTDAAGHVIPPLPDYARGMSTQNVPDMPDAGPGAVTYYWTNRDSGRLMMYHDHTSGTTRLNPYVGEAAGFVIADDKENALMRDVLGLNVATPSVVDIVAAEGIPLVFQDRSWVPNDIATQDSLWDQNAWGKPGDLWFPHVYETAGPNPAGRWDWGPDFPEWPGSLSTNHMRDPAGNWNDTLPTGAYGDVTHVPEAFMDTPIVNGTAYPTLTVEPKAYRFRVLSVGNDRAFNLGLYVAVDNNDTPCDSLNPTPAAAPVVPPLSAPVACSEIRMVPFDTTVAGHPNFPPEWGPADKRPNVTNSLSVMVTAPGRGYTAPLATITGAPAAGGNPARIAVAADPVTGEVSASMYDPGSQYDAANPPSVDICEASLDPTVCDANQPAEFVPAAITASIVDDGTGQGRLAFTITDGGAGYTNPLVVLTNGQPGDTYAVSKDPLTGAITGLVSNANPAPNYMLGDPAPTVQICESADGQTCDAQQPRIFQKAVAAASVDTIIDNLPLDLHPGGVPDPSLVGPDIWQIGTEGGLFKTPVRIPSTITNYENVLDTVFPVYNVNTPLLAVKERGLHLAPAERADVIIDFSQYAGKTLIVYNDSPAPSPGPDLRYDYFTGDPDRTAEGGAPTTLAGYGPNTRTIMQIKVGTQVTGNTTANWQSKLNAGLASAVDGTAAAPGPQDPLLTAPLALDGSDVQFTATGTLVTLTDPLDPTKKTILTAKEKTIFEDFDFKGRITATLGTWTPGNSAAAGTQQPQGYINPNTDTFPDGDIQGLDNGEVQVWRITHNGVDMHPLHWHLVNLQVIGRVGWDGKFRAPDKTEAGWKETVEIVPMMDTLVAVKAKNPKLPFGLPRSVRLLDPAQPVGSNLFFTQVDPVTGLQANFTNQYADFNWEYVWHCHILGHEENDLMRPLVLDFGATAPVAPTIDITTSSATSLAGAVNLKWTDPTPGWNGQGVSPALAGLAQDFTGVSNSTSGDVDLDPTKRKQSEIGFRVERAPVINGAVGTYAPTAAGKTTYPKGVADAVTGKFGLNSQGDKTKVATFEVNAIANATSYTDSSVPATGDFSYRVVSVNAAITGAGNWNGEQASAELPVYGLPAAPAGVSVNATGLVQWSDIATNETGYSIERAPVSTGLDGNGNLTSTVGAFAQIGSVAANLGQYPDGSIQPNSDYLYRVVAHNDKAAPQTLDTASGTFSVSATPAAPAVTDVLADGTVTWTDNATNETSYRVERLTVGAANAAFGPISPAAGLSVNSTSFTDTSRATNTDYQYRVVAKNSQGETVSNVFTASVAPAMVASVSVQSQAGSALVEWPATLTNQTGFNVYRATFNNGVAGTFGATPLNGATPLAPSAVNSYSDATIAANTDYLYRVEAVNGALKAPADPNGLDTAKLPQAPAAATGLAVAPTPAMTARALTLTWTDNSSNEDGFSVEASTDGGTTYTSLPATPVAQNQVSYAATVTPATTYQFRVAATKNLAGYTPVYTTTTATTPAELLAVTGLTANATLNGTTPQALISWVDASTGETGYQVDRCVATTATTCTATSTNWQALQTMAALPTPATGGAMSYTDGNMAAGTKYVYRVTVTGATAGPATLTGQVGTSIAMVAPSNLTATSPTGSGVTLNWTDTSTNETTFQVERATVTSQGTSAFAVVPSAITRTNSQKTATGAAVTFTDATAAAGASYLYQVRSVNVTGTTTSVSAASNQASITLGLPAPTALTAIQSGGSVVLKWTDNAATETGYEVARVDLTTNASTLLTATPLAANTKTYTDAGAPMGIGYRYEVRALNSAVLVNGLPMASPVATATITPVLPAPTLLTTSLTATAGTIALNWVDNATFETGYRIDRSAVFVDGNNVITEYDAAGFATAKTLTRSGNATTGTGAVGTTDVPPTTMPTLPSGAVANAYAYRVYATTANSVSIASNEAHTASAAASNGKPSALAANTSGGSSIVLSWIDTSTTETSFLVTRTDPANAITTFTVPRSLTQGSATNGTVSYSDITAVIGTPYSYTVAAVTPTGNVVSDPVTAKLTTAMPTNVTISATATGITVGWTDTSNNESGFQIVRNIAAKDSFGNLILDAFGNPTPAANTVATVVAVTSSATQKTATNAARTYLDNTVQPGVTYYYTVASGSGTITAGAFVPGSVFSTEAYSVPATITTSAMAAPGVPTIAIASATSLKLTWADLSNNETGFVVERTADGGATWTTLGATLPGATVTRSATQKTAVNGTATYTDTALAAGTYQYRVKSVVQTGTGAAAVTTTESSWTYSGTIDFTAPAAPTGLTAVAGATTGTVTLTWTDVATNETGYTIQNATNATFTKSLKTVSSPGARAAGPVTYTLTGLTKGSKLFFRVAAVNGALTSAYTSTTVAVTVP